jgi:hypothetical protein
LKNAYLTLQGAFKRGRRRRRRRKEESTSKTSEMIVP